MGWYLKYNNPLLSRPARGESANAFIGRAITEALERDITEGTPEAAGVGAVSFPADTLKAAQEAAQAAGEGLPQFIGRAVTTQAKRDKTARKLKGGKLNE